MPDGITHERFRRQGRIIVFPVSIFLPIVLSPIPMKSYGEILVGIGIFVGYEMGRYVTPDWDIMGTTSSEGWMVNEIPFLGHFLFGLSSAYGSIFRRHHRSTITHFPLISTSIRYVIIFWWIWLEIYRSSLDWAWLIFIFIGALIGTSISDGIHWYLDLIKYPKSE